VKPVVCSTCQLFFQIEKSGVYFEEGMPTETGWKSYKLWAGDLWKCSGCATEIIRGMGQTPIAEHYQPDYKEQLERYQPIFRVDDWTPNLNLRPSR